LYIGNVVADLIEGLSTEGSARSITYLVRL
jgi:hypothetical protein